MECIKQEANAVTLEKIQFSVKAVYHQVSRQIANGEQFKIHTY